MESCTVASLSLFYCYYFGHCSDELAACISPPITHYVPHSRQHLNTTIVWNSPMRELIGSVMVSSLLLPTFGIYIYIYIHIYIIIWCFILCERQFFYKISLALSTNKINHTILQFIYFINSISIGIVCLRKQKCLQMNFKALN